MLSSLKCFIYRGFIDIDEGMREEMRKTGFVWWVKSGTFVQHLNKKKKNMEIGLTYTSTVVVSKENIAVTMGSGDLEVFATPAMVALMENAAMNAVAGELPEGSTTVGALMNTSHVKPSAVGDTVSATATLKEVEGRKLTFEVKAEDSKGVVGEGTHVRYVVDREKFMAKLK
jgi:fluoroacetyl-CoA thioesterase